MYSKWKYTLKGNKGKKDIKLEGRYISQFDIQEIIRKSDLPNRNAQEKSQNFNYVITQRPDLIFEVICERCITNGIKIGREETDDIQIEDIDYEEIAEIVDLSLEPFIKVAEKNAEILKENQRQLQEEEQGMKDARSFPKKHPTEHSVTG